MEKLTVVIPTLCEEQRIAECLQAVGRRKSVTVVVSDGGSTDDTREIAESLGATVVVGPPGRGSQLNRGAAKTQTGNLLFVHADCRLPSGWYNAVDVALGDPATSLACFRLRTEPSTSDRSSRIRSLWLSTMDLRSRGRRLPYGDQGFAVRREVFDRVGSFPDIPLMEDLVFAGACRRIGRIRRMPLLMVTTARRLERFPTRARLMMIVFPSLFRLGVAPETLARWYGVAR